MTTRIVAIEEHFVTPEINAAWGTLDPRWQDASHQFAAGGEINDKLLDLGDRRLADMDAAGVDVQVVSLTTPGVQNLEPDGAVALAVDANDRLAEAIGKHPDRFQGWAAVATPSPAAGGRELERAVTRLGFAGGLLCGRTRDRNADHRDFWPIYEAAAAMRCPLYLHPQSPTPAVRQAHYDGFDPFVELAFATFGIGWHFEAGLQLLRLAMAGVFDQFPDLQIVTGHWGEVVLFYLERADRMAALARRPLSMTDYFRRHVSVTASGMYSPRYLRWATDVLGVDRILFSTDYPYVPAPGGAARRFLADADLSAADREKIASGNWERLVANVRR